jgi:hypothetical protein
VAAPGGGWQSCCVRVPNLQRSLLVVPRESVFEDAAGELAALEAAAAADPAQRGELLRALHVRPPPRRPSSIHRRRSHHRRRPPRAAPPLLTVAP